jgi:hypothetical protein
MDINEQIAALGARLDNWFDGMTARMDAGDKRGQAKEWLVGNPDNLAIRRTEEPRICNPDRAAQPHH